MVVEPGPVIVNAALLASAIGPLTVSSPEPLFVIVLEALSNNGTATVVAATTEPATVMPPFPAPNVMPEALLLPYSETATFSSKDRLFAAIGNGPHRPTMPAVAFVPAEKCRSFNAVVPI